MKAILTKCNVSNAINYSGEKELTNRLKLVAIKKGEISELIDCRFYMSRASSASVVYCALWVNGTIFTKPSKEDKINGTTPPPLHVYISGKGDARGYGYHKESAALQGGIDKRRDRALRLPVQG